MVERTIPQWRSTLRRQVDLVRFVLIMLTPLFLHMDGDKHVGGSNRRCRAFWFLAILR